MRSLLAAIAAAVIVAGCGGSSKSALPTRAIEGQSPVIPTSSSRSTPRSSCPTPPAGPVTARTYTGAATGSGQAMLNGVQVTTSACSDIAIFTFAGAGVPGYLIKYVPATSECGSGQPVTTVGAAQIYLRLEPAVAHDDAGKPTLNAKSQAPNLPSVMELKQTCDFEGVVAWAIGTAEKYFVVTTASSPPRIIVEVNH